MYEVWFDKECVSASYVPGSLFRDPVVESERNRAGSFTFTIPRGHPAENMVKMRKTWVVVTINGRLRSEFSGFPTRIGRNIFGEKVVTCTGDLARLSNAGFYQVHRRNQSMAEFVRSITANYNSVCTDAPLSLYEYVGGDVSPPTEDTIVPYGSCLDLAQMLVDEYGGYVYAFTTLISGSFFRRLGYVEEGFEKELDQPIVLKRNIIDLALEQSGEDICTVVFPLGAKKTDEEKDPDEIALGDVDCYYRITDRLPGDDNEIYATQSVLDEFGIIEHVVQWDGVKKAGTLKKKAQAYLNDYQFADISFEIRAVDLGYNPEYGDDDRIWVGHKARVISPVHGMDRTMIVQKKTIPLNRMSETLLTIGGSGKDTLTRYVVQGGKKKKRVYSFDSINPDEGGSGGSGGGTTTPTAENILTYNPNEKTLTITRLKNTPTYNASTKTLTIN